VAILSSLQKFNPGNLATFNFTVVAIHVLRSRPNSHSTLCFSE